MSRVLDVGVRIIGRHWPVLLGLAVLFFGPGALLTAATGRRFETVAVELFPSLEEGVIDASVVLTQAQFDRLLESLVIYVAATMAAGVLGSLGALGMSAVVGADYHHRPIAFGEALRTVFRRLLDALVFIIVSSIIVIAIGVAGVVAILVAAGALGAGALDQGGPGVFLAILIAVVVVLAILYLTMRWAPVLPALANEPGGWRAAMARSWHLSGENIWRIVAVIVLAALITALLAGVVSMLADAVLVEGLASALGLDTLVAGVVIQALVTVLFAVLAPVWVAVLYFDLRARRDGPEGPEAP